MSWQKEVDGIELRRRLALEHGGPEAVKQQHAKGRLTIRERCTGLLDEGSFREQGRIAGYSETDENGELRTFSPANYVLGFGKIEGSTVRGRRRRLYPAGRLAHAGRPAQERVY